MFARILCMVCMFAAALPGAARERERVVYGAKLEELEYRKNGGEKLLAWHGGAFAGNDNIKIRWITEGEYDLRENNFAHTENRLVAQIPASEFFDIKAGARLDTYGGGRERWHAVLGAEGLAPQWFEVDADFFLGEGARASARLDAEYELLFTNRFYAVFAAESTYAFASDNKAEIGAGLADLEAGVRLHYDLIDRNVSPYIGAVYEKKYGKTADFARAEGEADEEWFFVAGVKLMF